MARASVTRRTMLAAGAACCLTPEGAGVERDRRQDEPIATRPDPRGRPSADVLVNGSGPFRFLIDTGASRSLILRRLADELGLLDDGVIDVAGTTGFGQLPTTTLASLKAGVIARADMKVAVIESGWLGFGAGVLGVDAFGDRRLEFDLQRQTVRVLNPRPSRDLRRGNVRLLDGLALVEGRVDRVRTTMILDTGAQFSIMNLACFEALQKRRGAATEAAPKGATIVGVTGARIDGWSVRTEEVLVHAVRVSNLRVAAVAAPVFDMWGFASQPAMIVGSDILGRLSRFTLDYGARTFEAHVGPARAR